MGAGSIGGEADHRPRAYCSGGALLVKQDRQRGRGGVAVAVDVHRHPALLETQAAAHPLNDPGVGLMDEQ